MEPGVLKDRNVLHTIRFSCRATPLIVLNPLWPVRSRLKIGKPDGAVPS